MVTKEQERKALSQIKKIVDSLGEDSYIAMAFEGCFEDAEMNIENDWACSWKQRAEQNDKYATQWEKECSERAKEKEEALKKVEELQETIKKLSKKIFFEDELRDFYVLAEDDLFDTERHIEEEAQEIVKYAEETTSDKFLNSVTSHRAYTRRAKHLNQLLERISYVMKQEE